MVASDSAGLCSRAWIRGCAWRSRKLSRASPSSISVSWSPFLPMFPPRRTTKLRPQSEPPSPRFWASRRWSKAPTISASERPSDDGRGRSVHLDAVGSFRHVVMDRPSLLFCQQPFLKPRSRLLRHRRGSEHRTRTIRIVDLVRLQEEPSPACQGLRGELFFRQNRWHESRIVLGSCKDRKSTRLNSSHVSISYAVFCLKKIIP